MYCDDSQARRYESLSPKLFIFKRACSFMPSLLSVKGYFPPERKGTIRRKDGLYQYCISVYPGTAKREVGENERKIGDISTSRS